MTQDAPDRVDHSQPWYAGVTRYQWTVLVIASLGWVFDVFEGQIFVASMPEVMPSLMPESVRQLPDDQRRGYLAYYNNVALGGFLLGGALGGVGFGILSDRIGRKATMNLTILMYSLFTFVSACSQQWWHIALFRFLVAMGVGGEWAVASALVAEVFPQRARAWSLGIFHASSVLGTYLATAVGVLVIANAQLKEHDPSLPWRIAFSLGILPALLIIWIRRSLKEPEGWQRARTTALQDFTKKMGSFSDLFAADQVRATVVGVSLAAVGMATFWGAHIYGKDLLRRDVQNQMLAEPIAGGSEAILARVRSKLLPQLAAEEQPRAENILQLAGSELTGSSYEAVRSRVVQSVDSRDQRLAHRLVDGIKAEVLAPRAVTIKYWEMLGMFLVTTGGGLGLVSFGPLCEWLGRRPAFLLYHIGGLLIAVVTFQTVTGVGPLLVVLPVFGFLTLGMHAGYAIYFPELFPTRLRGTGGGFCFNFGRVIAAPILFLSGTMQRDWAYSLEDVASILSLLYLLGVVVLVFAPETRDRQLLD